MKETIKLTLKQYISEIFDSEYDCEGKPYMEAYKFEFEDKINDIQDLIEDKYYEDTLELGIYIKMLFFNTFRDTINLDRNIYINIAKDLLHNLKKDENKEVTI